MDIPIAQRKVGMNSGTTSIAKVSRRNGNLFNPQTTPIGQESTKVQHSIQNPCTKLRWKAIRNGPREISRIDVVGFAELVATMSQIVGNNTIPKTKINPTKRQWWFFSRLDAKFIVCFNQERSFNWMLSKVRQLTSRFAVPPIL